MRFLGIRTGADRPSDEEYIEMIRKGLRGQRWLRYVSAAAAFAWLYICVTLAYVFARMPAANPAIPATQQNLVYSIFAFAGLMGLVSGLALSTAMLHAAVAMFERRKDRMLVEFWDVKNQLLAEREQERSGKP